MGEQNYRPWSSGEEAGGGALALDALSTWEKLLEDSKLTVSELKKLNVGSDRRLQVGTQLLKVLEIMYTTVGSDLKRVEAIEKAVHEKLQAVEERLAKVEQDLAGVREELAKKTVGVEGVERHPVSYRRLLEQLTTRAAA